MTVNKCINKNYEPMLQLRVASALISTMESQLVVGKNTLPRGSGPACIRVTTVYFPQVYPVTPLLTKSCDLQTHMNPW